MKEAFPLARKLCVLLLTLVVVADCAARRERKKQDAAILSPEALYGKAMVEMEGGNLRKAKLYLDRIQLTAESRPSIEPLVRLAVADLAFFTGDDISLIDARSKYLDFVTLYGDHPRAPYAQIQAGVCSLKQVRHPTRDQSQTLVAIGDLREVGRRYADSPYARVAAAFLKQTEASLGEHDYQVGRFYLRRKAYAAAVDRFRSVLDRYPAFSGKEKLYFHLGQALLLMHNDTEGRIYLDKLIAEYPDGEFAEEARKLLDHAPSGEKANKKG